MDITPLKEDGLMILPGVLDKSLLDEFKEEYEGVINDRSKLKFHDDRFSMVNQPLVACTNASKLAFSDMVVEIASAYFKEFAKLTHKPGVGTCNLRRSYIYGGAQRPDTTMYHCDANRPDPFLLKFFIYLHDVDMESGPFVYAKGSHVDKPANCRQPYRKSDAEIENMYGNRITYVTAEYGDLIIACTNGFHKGLRNTVKTRDMFTINYVDAPENERFQISKNNLDKIDEDKKEYARFLDVV